MKRQNNDSIVTVDRPRLSPFAPRKNRCFRGAKGDNLRHIPCTAKFLSLTLAAGLACGLGSCRHSDRPVFPATGKVFYQGKPAEGARVTLVPLTDGDAKKPKPGAEVGPDGAFQLSTYASYDGAPPGSYAVLIVYPSPAKKVDQENAGPDLLQGRYADPKTTPLRAEIKQGTNELAPFNVR